MHPNMYCHFIFFCFIHNNLESRLSIPFIFQFCDLFMRTKASTRILRQGDCNILNSKYLLVLHVVRIVFVYITFFVICMWWRLRSEIIAHYYIKVNSAVPEHVYMHITTYFWYVCVWRDGSYRCMPGTRWWCPQSSYFGTWPE